MNKYAKIGAKGLDVEALGHAARAAAIVSLTSENLEEATYALINSAQPFEAPELDRLFQVVALYQKVFEVERRRKDSRIGVHEAVRQLLTGEANGQRWKKQSFGMMTINVPDEEGEESDLTFVDAIRFVKTLRDFKNLAYKALFDVVEGKGDDGYGDFLDSLILAGPDVYAKVLCGAYHKEGDWQRLQDDIREATPELADFIINGENYIDMFTVDAIKEFLHSWVSRQLEGERW